MHTISLQAINAASLHKATNSQELIPTSLSEDIPENEGA